MNSRLRDDESLMAAKKNSVPLQTSPLIDACVTYSLFIFKLRQAIIIVSFKFAHILFICTCSPSVAVLCPLLATISWLPVIVLQPSVDFWTLYQVYATLSPCFGTTKPMYV